MKIAATKNKSPLSWLIRWGLGEPGSHLVLMMNSGLVIHSNLWGVHPENAEKFLQKNEIVDLVAIPVGDRDENGLIVEILKDHTNKPYDFLALFYFIWRAILLKIFKIPLPRHNRWAQNGAYLCTKIYDVTPDDIMPDFEVLTGTDVEMISPWKILQKLKEVVK